MRAKALIDMWLSLKDRFNCLSFWKKIIFIFTLNCLILLILSDTIMLLLFKKLSDATLNNATSEKQSINDAFNSQIATSAAKLLLNKFDHYASMMSQILNVYSFFSMNPSLVINRQSSNPPNPLLTSDPSFKLPTYNQTAIYYFTNTSLFYPAPFIDNFLSFMLTGNQDMGSLVRINIYAQNTVDLTDLTIRTIPATNDFKVTNINTVNSRFNGLQMLNFTISDPYFDEYSMGSSMTRRLIAIRSPYFIPQSSLNTNIRILVEIELDISFIKMATSNLYYFPSSQIVLLYKYDNQSYSIVSSTSTEITAFAHLFLYSGNHKFTVNGFGYVGSTVSFDDSHKLGVASSVENETSDRFRCAVLIKSDQTYIAADFVSNFLKNQHITLQIIIFGWSIIIFISTIALSFVVGHYVFFNLRMLSKKLKEYLKSPKKYNKIIEEFKELQLKGIFGKLTENILTIIQKIEIRKKQKQSRVFPEHDCLNIAEPKFQERQELNDYLILDQLKQKILRRTISMKTQAPRASSNKLE